MRRNPLGTGRFNFNYRGSGGVLLKWEGLAQRWRCSREMKYGEVLSRSALTVGEDSSRREVHPEESKNSFPLLYEGSFYLSGL